MSKKSDRELKKAADNLLALYELSPAAIAGFAFGNTETFWMALGGVDWQSDAIPDLSIMVVDAMSGEVLHQSDPIGELIETYGDGGDEGSLRLERAIQALQAGVDRIKAFQNGETEAP